MLTITVKQKNVKAATKDNNANYVTRKCKCVFEV